MEQLTLSLGEAPASRSQSQEAERDDGQITGPMKFTLLRNKGISTDRAWTIGTLLQAYEISKAEIGRASCRERV